MNLGEEYSKLCKRRLTLVGYLGAKVEEQDWHGVADAAMDLREVDAKLELLKNMPNNAEWKV